MVKSVTSTNGPPPLVMGHKLRVTRVTNVDTHHPSLSYTGAGSYAGEIIAVAQGSDPTVDTLAG